MYFAEKHQYILISREENEIRRLQEKIRVLELENKNLLSKNTELTSENSVLLNKIRYSENDKKKYSENIGKIFTSRQMKKIMDPNCKRIRWSSDDIASAMSLRSVSKKAYRYLRAHNYPFPALSTLRRWAATFNLDQGIFKGCCYFNEK
jgi:hypothetical protein